MLTTGDAAPDIKEIFTLFHFRWGRRMIGADRGDGLQPGAKTSLFIGRSKRRRALRDSAEPFHIRLRQDEVMRAGFTGHIDSVCTRFGDKRHAASAADMHDVESATALRRSVDRAAD